MNLIDASYGSSVGCYNSFGETYGPYSVCVAAPTTDAKTLQINLNTWQAAYPNQLFVVDTPQGSDWNKAAVYWIPEYALGITLAYYCLKTLPATAVWGTGV